MIVEEPDIFRDWLACELTSRVDADPIAVARYALALVQKDAPEDELKPSICNDLTVFLQEETTEFVELMFKALKSRDYIQNNTNNTDQGREVEKEEDTADRRESRGVESDDALSDDDRDHKRTQKRSRSRSHSQDTKQLPRRSPHRRFGYRHGHSRGNRRTGDIKSRLGRAGYRNDPTSHRRYDNNFSAAPGRRRSRSPYRKSRSPHRSSSPRRSPHRSVSPKQSPRSAQRSPSIVRSRSPHQPPSPRQTKTESSYPTEKPRCRNYDEKGFCLQGEFCPYAHGSDALVMTDVAGLHLASTNGQQMIPPLVSQSSPALIPGPPHLNSLRTVHPEPYNPDAPRMRHQMPALPLHRPPRYMPQRPPMTAIIPTYPVPMAGPVHRSLAAPYRQNAPNSFNPMQGMTPPKFYDPNRATLEVKNLPAEFNNISKLNEHFSKFGTIINLQVKHAGQADAALITFSSHHEAKAAHQNPEPIFNNRFIKVFWHSPTTDTTVNADQLKTGNPGTKLAHKSSSNNSLPSKKVKVEPNMNPATLKLDKLAKNRRVLPASPGAAIPVSKNQQQRELEQKVEALFIEQVQKHKAMVEEADNCKDPVHKSKLIKRIKELSEAMQIVKKQIESFKLNTEAKRKKEKVEKEVLDTEIDVHQKQQAGEDTAALQLRLEELKKQANALGILPGRGGGRGHGRPVRPMKEVKVAPTAISVTGFKPEERQAVLLHFKAFGQVTEKDFNAGPPTSMVVEYASSHDAKVAATHGTEFNSRKLILKWYKAPAPPSQPVSSLKEDHTKVKDSEEAVLDAGADELLDGDQEGEEVDDALLLGDDDEDDSEKKRSWL